MATMNTEKLIYLSLGVLAVVGIILTTILVQRARGLDQQAAQVEKQESFVSPVVREGSPSAMPEASSGAQEASPSVTFRITE